MIKKMEPITMNEVLVYLDETEGDTSNAEGFLKKFVKLDNESAGKLKKDLLELNILRLNPEHVIKIVDIAPRDIDELNKIFNDVSFDEDEAKKILEKIKEFR